MNPGLNDTRPLSISTSSPVLHRRPSLLQVLERTQQQYCGSLLADIKEDDEPQCSQQISTDIYIARGVPVYFPESSLPRQGEDEKREQLIDQQEQQRTELEMEDTEILLDLNVGVQSKQVIVDVIRKCVEAGIIADPGSDDTILQRYGLYEAEFIYDEDEDMSLFSASESSSSPAASDTPTGTSLVERKSISRNISVDSIQRRTHRLLGFNEIPFFVYNNWRFYRRLSRPNRRAARNQILGSGRRLHFLVKALTADDQLTLALAAGQKLQPEIITQITSQHSIDSNRIQHLMSMPVNKLERRLSLVEREEQRAIDEAKERYAKQKAWIQTAFGLGCQ